MIHNPFPFLSEKGYDANHIVEIKVDNNEKRIYTRTEMGGYSFLDIQENSQNRTNLIEEKFLSDRKKGFIFIASSLYHINNELFPIILDVMETYDAEIIIGLDKFGQGSRNIKEYLECVVNFLNKKYDNRIKMVYTENKWVTANNLFLIEAHNYMASPKFITSFKEMLKDIYPVENLPKKKVYLSRKKMFNFSEEEMTRLEDYEKMSQRILDEEYLENFLASIGFEIIVPETDFASFQEQALYFSNVDTLISCTSSGFGNAYFMPEGSCLIELAALFYFKDNVTCNCRNVNSNNIKVSTHNQYSVMSMQLGMDYVRIPNFDRSAQNLVEHIKNSKILKRVFEIND